MNMEPYVSFVRVEETGRCVDADNNIGKFQATTWEGYPSGTLFDTFSPASPRKAPSSATLLYETLTPSICSINDGENDARKLGEVTGIETDTCDIKLIVQAEGHVDKEFRESLEVGLDTRPSFAHSAAISNIATIVGVDINTITLPEASDGNEDITYSIFPPLPGGLILNVATRELSGIPVEVLNQTRFTYTVTDANGDSDSINFNISIFKGTQTFTWPAHVYGEYPLPKVRENIYIARSITGGKGNPEFRSADDEICTVTSNGVTVTGNSVGVCTIEARWTGDANWYSGPWSLVLSTRSQSGGSAIYLAC